MKNKSQISNPTEISKVRVENFLYANFAMCAVRITVARMARTKTVVAINEKRVQVDPIP